MRPPTWRDERVRFLAVGALNTLFGYLCFVVLETVFGETWPYLVVLVASYAIALLFSFTTQRWLVFRVRGRLLGDFARFTAVSLAGFAVNVVTLTLFIEVARLPVLPAQAAAIVVNALVLYTAHRRISFARPLTTGGDLP